ncbi:MAG: chloride channel protein [Planctomycetota bacterium]
MLQRLLGKRTSIYLLSAVVGVVAGLGAIGFEYLSGWIVELTLVGGAGYRPVGPRGELHLFEHEPTRTLVPWMLVLAPAIGGLLSGLICHLWAPEATGHGTDAAIDGYHQKGGRIRGRVPFVKAITSAITLGTGGSGGREGPIAQIGAGFGSLLGQKLQLSEARCRTLLAAGMAAGVGAIFRAPFAGALFASEILYREAEIESEVLMPAFVSSTVSYCVFCGWLGEFGSLFQLGPGFRFHDLQELLPYTMLALLLLPLIAFYTRFFYGSERWFKKVPGPRPLVAALGGLLCGAIALALWAATGEDLSLSVLSYGYGILQETLDGNVTGWNGARLLLLVAVLKVVTTSCTIASGGSGGVFGPSMVIGGGLGGAVGIACYQWGLVENPGSLVIVGMCGFFAGAAKTPISTIVMVTEMTGSYKLLLPAMWVCGITFLLSHRWALYQKQVAHRAMSPAHRGEYQVALLEKMTVEDVYEPTEVEMVPSDTPLRDILQLFVTSREDYFPVADRSGKFVGIFSARDVRQFTYDQELYRLAIAADVMSSPPITVTPDDDLHMALEKFDQTRLDELPIVDARDPNRILGRLQRREIGRAYTQKLKALKKLQDEADAARMH